MTEPSKILCLDLATRLGFAEGQVGETPITGSHRLAPAGANHGEIGLGLLKWLDDRLRLSPPRELWVEAPITPSIVQGKTHVSTIRILCGLCFIADTVAQGRGVWRRREVATSDVRRHFLGSNPKRDAAKALTLLKCRSLGWEVCDDNAADAAALFSFASEKIEPGSMLATKPLFRGVA